MEFCDHSFCRPDLAIGTVVIGLGILNTNRRIGSSTYRGQVVALKGQRQGGSNYGNGQKN